MVAIFCQLIILTLAGLTENKQAGTVAGFIYDWSREWDLNPQPTVYDTVALPVELSRPN